MTTPAIKIGSIGQIPKGEGRVFDAAGRPVAVFHTHAGEVFATQAECPHQRGPLADGLTGGATVVCPLHERSFDLRTGSGLNGETSSLQVFPVSLDRDGKIWISLPGRDAGKASDRGAASFIRIAEIWVPTEDGRELRLLDGLYGDNAEFRARSEGLRLGFDEGLPGKAWAAQRPVLLKQFTAANFTRAEAAAAIGLTCGVALPVFAGGVLKAVVVFLCGDGTAAAGALELWHNDPARHLELRLVDGYYGQADDFALDARYSRFPRGYGLPGRAWKSNMPLLVGDLRDSHVFLRWKQALAIGINRGLAIPYPHPSGEYWVLTFLSAQALPLARRFEIWTPNGDDALVFQAGDCDQGADLAAEYRSARIAKGEATVGRAWLGETAAVSADVTDGCSAVARSAAASGLRASLALPFISGGETKAIVAWYF
jgi:nitrite reductase/ring-hydroxylating ferredoxin subunit